MIIGFQISLILPKLIVQHDSGWITLTLVLLFIGVSQRELIRVLTSLLYTCKSLVFW